MALKQYKYADITEKVIGCAMRVHSALGNGFQQAIYQRCLQIEIKDSAVNALREPTMPILYKGVQVGTRRVDFLVEDKIPVECKAVNVLEEVHLAQALNYLEVYNLEIGLLLNFGARKLEFHRLINNRRYDPGKP